MLLLAASPLTHPSDADDQAEGFKRVKDRITIVVITNAAGYFDVSTTFFAFHFESNRIPGAATTQAEDHAGLIVILLKNNTMNIYPLNFPLKLFVPLCKKSLSIRNSPACT